MSFKGSVLSSCGPSFLQGTLEQRCTALQSHLLSLVEPRKNARAPADEARAARRPGSEVPLIRRALIHARRAGISGPDAVEYLLLLTLPLRVRFNARLQWKDHPWPQIPLAQVPEGSRAHALLRQVMIDRDAAWPDQSGSASPVRVPRDDPVFVDGALWRQRFFAPPVVAYPLTWHERCSFLAPTVILMDAFRPARPDRSVTTCWTLELLSPLPREPTPEEKPAHVALEAALDALPSDPQYEAGRRRGGDEDPLRIDLGGGLGVRIFCDVQRHLRTAHGVATSDVVTTRFFLSESNLSHREAVEAAGYGTDSPEEIGAPVIPTDLLVSSPEGGLGSAPLWRLGGPGGGATVPFPWAVIPSTSTAEEANLIVFLSSASTAWSQHLHHQAYLPGWPDLFGLVYSAAEQKDLLAIVRGMTLRELDGLAISLGWKSKDRAALRLRISECPEWLRDLAVDLVRFKFPGTANSLRTFIRQRALREWAPRSR